jgi:menaquinone-dependent protoporphyrinogen oxidase
MRVLVAYGSKMGGTAGLAEMVGAELVANGLEVEVKEAKAVHNVKAYGAVVVGGALYTLRWHPDARRFVRRHRRALSTMPVWLFSSGPLDDSASATEIPPVRFVRKAMDQIGAKGHVTFGGRMPADAKGFPAASMARDNAGDWRDVDHVRDWSKLVAEELHAG